MMAGSNYDDDMTIMSLLLATNELTGFGADLVYDSNADGDWNDDVYLSNLDITVGENVLRTLANDIYDGINNDGDI